MRTSWSTGAARGRAIGSGVTGRLGGAGAGLMLLEGLGAPVDPQVRRALEERHRRPAALLSLGRDLARAGVTSMIDVSDGIATDAAHLAAESGVAIEIDLEALPLAMGAANVAEAAGITGPELAATGGDDYELLFTAPEERVRAVESVGELTWIGSVATGSGLTLRDRSGSPLGLEGYEHG